MKKLMTILLAATMPLAAAAQSGIKELWHDKSTRGFELTLKGFVAPWGGYHETLEPSRHFKDCSGGAAIILSYRVNKCLSIGGSWEQFITKDKPHGFVAFPLTGMIIPLAANIKVNFMESKKLSPYFLAVVGLDIAGNIGSECPVYCNSDISPNYSRYPDNNGYPPEARIFHVSPSIGCDFPVAKWCTLFTEIRADWVPDYSFMVSVGAGVTFMLNNKNK